MTTPSVPAEVMQVVRLLDASTQRLLGGRLVGTYLHGSVALAGFNPVRSDVDVLFIADDHPRIGAESLQAIAGKAAATGVAGRGLELSVVDVAQAAQPAPPWPFLLHVSTDPDNPTVVIGRGHAGDPDLLMHYAVTRATGIAVRGPAPTDLIGDVARVTVLRYLVDELDWAVRNAGEAYAELNAGRALKYLHDGGLVSKLDGGRFAQAMGAARHIVEQAMAVQTGGADDRSPTPDALAFIGNVKSELDAAANRES